MHSPILNVDSNSIARANRRHVLEKAGLKTIESDNGAEALGIARSNNIAAALVSSRLRDGDGFALCRRMKDEVRTAGIPLLIISPPLSMDDYARAVEAGADAWLGEPFETSVLVKTVQAIIMKNERLPRSLGYLHAHEHAEELLRQSEERFRLVFDAIPEPTLITQADDDRITNVNARFLEVSCYSRHEVIGRTTEELGLFVRQPDREFVWSELSERGWLSDFDVIFRIKSGALLIGLWSSVKVTVQGRQYLVSTIRDITHRRRAEEALRRQAAFDQLLNSLLSEFVRCNANEIAAAIDRGFGALAEFFRADHLLLFEFSHETNTWRINREWCALHVARIADACNQNVYWNNEKFLSDADIMIDPDNPGAESGYDIPRCREEGATVMLNVPIKGVGGRITGRLGLHRHATHILWPPEDASRLRVAGNAIASALEHMRAEESLQQSEQRFRSMADSAPMATWISGPDMLAVFYSKWATDFAGRPMEALIGNGWKDFLHPDDRVRCLAACVDAAEARKPFSVEARFRRADGEYRWILITGVPRVVDGAYQGHVGTGVDITSLKRAYEQNLAFQKQESLGFLAAGVAHNFNNLLGAVVVLAESAIIDLERHGEVSEDLQQIRTKALQAANIVSQVMTFASVDNAPLAPLELSPLIDPILDLLRASIPRTANLKAKLAPDLPQVNANPGEIKQMLMNLVINASESLEGKPGDIVISTAPGPYLAGSRATVSIKVRDTGCGMNDQTKSRIFDPFFTTRSGRPGLGLSAVQGIVRRHGGSIAVESKPGEGSQFTILLPRSEAAVPEISPTLHSDRKAASGSKVLLVEDEDSFRSIIAKLLNKRGFQIMEAADGTAAMQILKANSDAIGVIILDVTLPEMSGLDVFDQLRRIKPNVNIVLSTAFSREDVNAEFGKRDIQGFIRKPYQIDELDRVLLQIFGKRALTAGGGA
jgi:PAS domain S-box-containing protein